MMILKLLMRTLVIILSVLFLSVFLPISFFKRGVVYMWEFSEELIDEFNEWLDINSTDADQ